MKTKQTIFLFILTLLLALPGFAQNKLPTALTKLFDGKTLDGWEGDSKVFRVEGGAIVGGAMTAPQPRNEFLCTKAEYGDFVLTLRFKLVGDPANANAGIQIRSRRIPNNHEVIGYQADLGQNYYGALYDESRRKKVLAGPKPEEIDKFLKRGEWNEYEIRAEGNQIRLAINGYPTVDYTESEVGIEPRGHICLQLHAGPPSMVSYQDIRIAPIQGPSKIKK